MDKVMKSYLKNANEQNSKEAEKPSYEELEAIIASKDRTIKSLMYEVRRYDQNYMNK